MTKAAREIMKNPELKKMMFREMDKVVEDYPDEEYLKHQQRYREIVRKYFNAGG